MVIRKLMAGGLMAAVALMGTLSVAATGISLEGVKCLIVAKNDAKEEQSAEWKKGKVFFCCGNCKGKYEGLSKEEKKKLAPKANAQLVATKQYVQKKCPVTGRDLNPEMKVKAGGAEVTFCCGNCKGKAEGMEEEEQLVAVFGPKAFKAGGFEPVKEEDEE